MQPKVLTAHPGGGGLIPIFSHYVPFGFFDLNRVMSNMKKVSKDFVLQRVAAFSVFMVFVLVFLCALWVLVYVLLLAYRFSIVFFLFIWIFALFLSSPWWLPSLWNRCVAKEDSYYE